MSHRLSQSGISLAEYGLILACVVCLCVVGLQSLGSQISGNFDFVAKQIGKVSGSLNSNNSPASSPPSRPNLNGFSPDTDMEPYSEVGVAVALGTFMFEPEPINFIFEVRPIEALAPPAKEPISIFAPPPAVNHNEKE